MKEGVYKFLFLCLTFIFLIGVVSAWSVDITKLNNNAPTNYYSAEVTQFSYQINGINCLNITRTWYTLDDGATNSTISCGTGELTLSGLSSNEGNNSWTIYSNSSGIINSDNVQFWVDSISPILNYIIPSVNLAYTNLDTLSFQFYLDELNKGFYWGLPDKYFSLNLLNKYGVNFYSNVLGIDVNNNSEQDNVALIGGNKYEGNYIWTTLAKDIFPDGSMIREITLTGTIIRDITAPTITDDYANDGIWVNLDQIVTLIPLDLLSYIGDVKSCEGALCDPNAVGTILGIPYQLNYNSDQDIIVRYQVWDLATNPSVIGEYNIKLDKTAPVTTDDALAGWQNSDQTITLFPTDPLTNGVASGITDTFYQVDGSGFTNYLASILVNQEGTHSVDYYSTDLAGNTESTNSISVMIDKSLPVSLITSPATSSWQNSDFNVARTDSDVYSGLASCEIQITDNGIPSLLWTPTPCNTDYLLDISTYCLTEGTDVCQVEIRSADNVAWISNVDNRTFSIDITPPIVDAGLDILTNSPISQDATVNASISGVASYLWTGPVEINFGTPNAEDTTISANTNGIYTIRLTATDNAGNSAFDEMIFEWDTTAPIVNINSLLTNDPTPELTGTIDDATATIQINVNGNIYVGTNNGDGTWTLTDNTIFPNLVDGMYDVSVSATDLAGNIGTDATLNELEIDTTAPVISINSLLTNDQSPELTGTIDDVTATIQVIVDGNNYVATNNGDGTWTLIDNTIPPNLIDGIYDVSVSATDLAGNIGTDATLNELEIDTTLPSITSFQAIPSQNISQNNPTTINATDVNDANLAFTGLMFVDFNNLISSDQILFIANMDDAPVSGPYGPINWDANYFKITDGTISEPVSVFVTDFAPAEYVVMGYLQEDPAIPTPVEDCMLGFDDTTNELTTSYCGNSTIDGISKFTIKSLKFSNGIFSPPSEINGSAFTLDFSNPANLKLESSFAPSGDYNLILQVEDSAGNENGEILNISVDNTYPSLTNIALSSSVISPINADGFLDDLTITMNASELVDWGTLYIYNSTGDAVNRYQSFPDWVLSNTRIWDGQYNFGYGVGYVPDGIYTLTLTTTLNKALEDSAGNVNSSILVGSVIVDNTIPTLSSISATSITSSSASIIWNTNENANSNVSYGLTNSTNLNLGSATQLTSHSIGLTSLSASTLYYYNVSGCDVAGNCNVSTQYSFTTSAQDDGGNGGGGGGGGGGGSSSIKYYECSEWAGWSVCSNNLQTRTCLEKITTTSQKGVILSKFNETETQACNSALTPLSNTNTETGKTEITPVESSEKTPTFIGRITGGITGAAVGFSKSKGGKISLIVIAVLALAWMLLAYKRKINRQKQERKIRIIHKGGLGKRNI